MDELDSYYEHSKEQIKATISNLTHVRGDSVFGDMAVEILRGLVTNNASIHTLNVTNHGALPDFADDRVVEVPARLEPKGATPFVQPHLPPEVTGLLHMLGEYQWLAADAIWNGDRRGLTHALASNPLVLSLSLADKLLDDIIPLQKQYFPNLR